MTTEPHAVDDDSDVTDVTETLSVVPDGAALKS